MDVRREETGYKTYQQQNNYVHNIFTSPNVTTAGKLSACNSTPIFEAKDTSLRRKTFNKWFPQLNAIRQNYIQ